MSFKRKIVNPSLAAALQTWRELDKSEESQREVEELVQNLTEEELEKKFLIRLSFGTAGLRGVMGPGYNCINDVTVQQTSQGYCAYLLDRFGDDGKQRGVFIGFDGRYNSENFAHLTAAAFLARGMKVRLASSCVPTPVVAYAVQKLLCVGGVVITASHNPKEYNGYKVYGENGAQILSPVDSDISGWINNSLTLWKEVEVLFDRRSRMLSAAGEKHPLLDRVFDSVVDLYIEDIAADLATTEGTEGGGAGKAAAEEAAATVAEEARGGGGAAAGGAAAGLAAAAADFAAAADLAAAAAEEGGEGGRADRAARLKEAAAAAAEGAAAAGAEAAAAADLAAAAAAGTADSPAAGEEEGKKRLRVVYTALHGVGTAFVQRMLRAFAFPGQLILVKEQCSPDPEFPTVDGRPNPEEKHSLDLAIETANLHGATLVIANDPDADRFAAAEKHAGRWVKYTGDEMGVLLAAYAMKLRESQGIPKERMAFVSSAVSSRMLEKMARKNGCCFAETLTGFKWMEAKGQELSAAGYFPVLLYEEALGYALSSSVRDKDGISAAAVFLQCAAALYAEGKQVQDMLLELRRMYGCFATQNSYFLCSSSSSVPRFFYALTHSAATAAAEEAEEAAAAAAAAAAKRRRAGEEETGAQRQREEDEREKNRERKRRENELREYPGRVGPFKVVRVRDVARGYDSTEENCCCSLPPNEEMLTFYFDNGAVLTLRGSGTEPKLKYYAEACGTTPQQGREILEQLVEAFVQEFIKPREILFLNIPQ